MNLLGRKSAGLPPPTRIQVIPSPIPWRKPRPPGQCAFEILDDGLFTLESFNYEEKNVYDIKVRSTDFGGLWIEEEFKISVLDINDRPVAYDQTVITMRDKSVKVFLTGFDEDGDHLTFMVTNPPKFGTLSGVAPKVTYTPNQGYEGTDSFRFTANDGALTSKKAAVEITLESKWMIGYWIPIFIYSEQTLH